MQKISLTETPATEPVELAALKADLSLNDTHEDTLLTCLLAAARLVAEARTGLVFLSQKWQLALDLSRDGVRQELPLWPVRRVCSARLTDGFGRSVPIDPARVRLETNCRSQWVALDGLEENHLDDDLSTLEIEVTAGMADTVSDLPAGLQDAVISLAKFWFVHRTPVAFGSPDTPIPDDVAAQLQPFAFGAWPVEG